MAGQARQGALRFGVFCYGEAGRSGRFFGAAFFYEAI